jgi:AcrR family transcriptional regulator
MSKPIEKSRREENSEATRQALLDAARDLFTRDGYNATGIESIAKSARVTRGAFYHYFADKKALLDAVVVALQADAAASVEARAREGRDKWKRFNVGMDAYLDACFEPSYLRLVIQEAPAVLGMARFREIDEANVLRLMTPPLSAMKSKGDISVDSADLLSRMMSAMIWEVALLLPDARNPAKLRGDALKIMSRVLTAFRTK